MQAWSASREAAERGSCDLAGRTLRAGHDRGEQTDCEQLMTRYQQGDPNAAAELVRWLSPRVLAFLAGPELKRSCAEKRRSP